MMSMKDEPGDCSSCEAILLIAFAKLAAVTFSPVENLKPGGS